VPIRDIGSPSHRIEVARAGRRATVRLGAGDTLPNKDFVLRYQVAGEAPAFALLGHREAGAGSFFFLAQPPATAAEAAIAPREIVFLLDTSSSMSGAPLAKAKQLIRTVLGGLRADDTFQIVRFDDDASALGPRPIANKPRNLGYVLEWLDALPAGGGTEMVRGVSVALDLPHDPARLRIVVFLTDGYVGNEDQILALVGDKLGASRLFSFGVGSAVNRYLLGRWPPSAAARRSSCAPTRRRRPRSTPSTGASTARSSPTSASTGAGWRSPTWCRRASRICSSASRWCCPAATARRAGPRWWSTAGWAAAR
jgi:Ca-activated chloride channel family protein